MRGRHPSGPEFVDKLQGLPEAKLRLKVVLETLDGSCRIQEACEQAGHQGGTASTKPVRIKLLQAAVNAAEPPAGGTSGRASRRRPKRRSGNCRNELHSLKPICKQP